MDLSERTLLVSGIKSSERLDVFVTRELGAISRSQIQKMIVDQKIILNGKIANKKDTVSNNDVIKVSFSGIIQRGIAPKAQDISIEILYEDEYLIAINKRPGLVVHPGSGISDGTLVNALMHHCKNLPSGSSTERPGIVHRLDKDTSGVIIAAKTNRAHELLSAAFMNRTIRKVYIGFCVGNPQKDHGMIDLPLDRSKREPTKRAPSVHGKPSKTEYFVLKQRCGINAMKFILHTGRTHQIRVHCSAVGFPIICDSLYGGGRERVLKIDPLDRPFAYTIFKCFTRQALHAYSLSFDHPITGVPLEITAPVPDDFNRAMILFGDRLLFQQNF